MTDKVVTLPNAAEIMERLNGVYDDAYVAERFYSLIAHEAGHELVSHGIVMMFALKIHDFVQLGYPPFVADLLHMYVPWFIDALVDDSEVAQAAKQIHQDVIDESRTGN